MAKHDGLLRPFWFKSCHKTMEIAVNVKKIISLKGLSVHFNSKGFSVIPNPLGIGKLLREIIIREPTKCAEIKHDS